MATSLAGIALALMPSAAAAAPSFSDSYTFRGNALITGGSAGGCGAAVCWSGGSGTYTFSSTTCAYVSDYEPSDPATPVEGGNCSISDSGGSFTNVVCGTGQAMGTANITPTSGADVGESTTLVYVIPFKGTIGTITAVGTETDSGLVHATGAVQISSSSVSPPTLPLASSPCTSSFSVSGHFEVTDDVGE